MNLSINLPNSPVNLIMDKDQEAFAIAKYMEAKGKETAEQQALSICYTVEELTQRLKCSRPTVLKLLREEKLPFTTIGDSKGYRVSEKAVRKFLGDM